jgi:GTP 3',8-cyclase
MLKDTFGRPITYLRISVTDRCNLRCVYCMPAEGIELQSHDVMISYEEIAQVVHVAAANGVREIRLTGGEPLVRRDLPRLVQMISETPGVDDISLTTNGLLLEKMAAELRQAGLSRINVSLDTLQSEKFARITRGGSLDAVWRGISAAEAQGMSPIKINVVAMRGVNDEELVEMARLSLQHPWVVRFIELMPIDNQVLWGPGFPPPEDIYLSVQEMIEMLEPYGLKPVNGKVGSGPAREYCLDGAMGKVGFISPVGEHFCQDCNRLRMTSDGNLRPCLLSDVEVPLRDAIRRGDPLLPLIEKAVALKPQGHELSIEHIAFRRCMRQIGG